MVLDGVLCGRYRDRNFRWSCFSMTCHLTPEGRQNQWRRFSPSSSRATFPWCSVPAKTRAELEVMQLELGISHPFISENGAAVFRPARVSSHSSSRTRAMWLTTRLSRSGSLCGSRGGHQSAWPSHRDRTRKHSIGAPTLTGSSVSVAVCSMMVSYSTLSAAGDDCVAGKPCRAIIRRITIAATEVPRRSGLSLPGARHPCPATSRVCALVVVAHDRGSARDDR
jgi:hypothetical protein